LEELYDAIESGEHGSYLADDFFQTAAWHPYLYAGQPGQYFVAENNKIYEVIKRREGKDKKVFLTEFGWDERFYSMDKIAEGVEKLFDVISTEMSYVESLHYLGMFNNVADNMNSMGIFCDPNLERRDINPKTKLRETPSAPKLSAIAYKKAAGGTGSLNIMKTEL
jgi:hypothetical protein